MATETTKKTATKKTTTTTKSDLEKKNKALVKENKDMKAKQDTMQAQIDELTNLFKASLANASSTVVEVNTADEDEYIEVISLCVGVLNLTTEPNGQGTAYTFSEFGEINQITKSDLKMIIKHNSGLMKNGRFCLANKEDISKLKLTDVFSKMIDYDTMVDLVSGDSVKLEQLYRKLPKGQKESIVQYAIEKMRAGEHVDANFLQTLSALSGKNLINIDLETND